MSEFETGPWQVQRKALEGFLTQVSQQAQHVSERHGEVLDAAMSLIAERGLSGASLRELARRLNVSQPSLYAYFKSKDELIEQIVARFTTQTFSGLISELPERYTSVQHFLETVATSIIRLWERPTHVSFVRFMHAVALEKAEYGLLMRRYLHDRGREIAAPLMAPFIATGELDESDACHLFDMVSNTLVMHFIKRRVMHAADDVPGEVERLAKFVVQVGVAGIANRPSLGGASE